jgi:hypothetical protein
MRYRIRDGELFFLTTFIGVIALLGLSDNPRRPATLARVLACSAEVTEPTLRILLIGVLSSDLLPADWLLGTFLAGWLAQFFCHLFFPLQCLST